MSRVRTYFWSSWPPASQYRFFKYMLLGTMGLTLSVFIGFKLFSGTVIQQIAESKEQYSRVLPLVEDVKTLRAQQGDLSHLDVNEAVWRIAEDLCIEKNLASIHPSAIDNDTMGFQVTFSGLSLTKLTDFLRSMRDRASLQPVDFTLTRNPDNARLADAHMILTR